MLKSSLVYCGPTRQICLVCRYWRHPCPHCRSFNRTFAAAVYTLNLRSGEKRPLDVGDVRRRPESER